MEHHGELTNFIWSAADLLRGDYKQSEYGRVVLPLTVIRRLDSVLAPTKARVLAEHDKYRDKLGDEALADLLNRAAGHTFHEPPRPLEEINAEIEALEGEILALLSEPLTQRYLAQHSRP